MKKTFALIAMFACTSVIQAYEPLDNIQDTRYELISPQSYQTNPIFDLDFNQFTGGHVIIDNTKATNPNIDVIKQVRLHFDGLKPIVFNNIINREDEWYSYAVAKNAWIFKNVVAVIDHHKVDGGPDFNIRLYSVPVIPDHGFKPNDLPWEWQLADLMAKGKDVTGKRLADRLTTNVQGERVTFNLYSRLVPQAQNVLLDLYVNWYGVGRDFHLVALPLYLDQGVYRRQATKLEYDDTSGLLNVSVTYPDEFSAVEVFTFNAVQIMEEAIGVPFPAPIAQ